MTISGIDFKKTSLIARAIRSLAIDGVQKANSGHPGMPLGSADLAAVLFGSFLRFNPLEPEWPGRDRFVLSAGHGSMLLYSLLHLFGYDLALSELQNFRQWQSKTPGHPEFGLTPGVETTTGPLGQGFANGVGLALSARLLQEQYKTDLFSSRVYGIVSDGDLMEGVASEAASLAGHLQLGNLIYLYDDNQISIGGSTDVCFTEDVPARFKAYGWHVQSVNGHDPEQIHQAILQAINENQRPSIICARTTIGFGSPHMAGSAESHGAPLGEAEVRLTKESLGCHNFDPFFIEPEALKACHEVVALRKQEHAKWLSDFEDWSEKNPQQRSQLNAQLERNIPQDLKADLLQAFSEKTKEATRNCSGKALQVLSRHLPFLIGGSADLEPSNMTLLKDSSDVTASSFTGRNLRFGVREHAMGSIINGLAYTRAWIPYAATFLVFADYMRPAIRLAALSHLQSIFIFTHDSFWVGEDGPTHQPIEQIASLRLIPGLNVFRPADGLETAMSYLAAVEHKSGPSALLFTRQGVPTLERSPDFDPQSITRGAYVLSGSEHRERVIVATGSEVWLAVAAAQILAKSGYHFRVISMPCQELFLKQDRAFRESIIPAQAKVVTLEAGLTTGWQQFSGLTGLNIGIDHYGASAPGGILAEKFGFTPEVVTQKVLHWLESA